MVSYFTQDTDFKFVGKRKINNWLKLVATSESKQLDQINIIFCSDSYLLAVNKKFLNHDYYTDIITFDYCDANKLSGDLFISIDTVRANADFYQVPFLTELNRVIVHGILHLVGYDDATKQQQTEIHSKEDHYLEILNTL